MDDASAGLRLHAVQSAAEVDRSLEAARQPESAVKHRPQKHTDLVSSAGRVCP